MLATHGTGSSGSLDSDNFFLSSKDHAPPVIARTDRGRPASLLNGWNRNLRPIDIELNGSEEKNGRVLGAVAHVVNLNRSRTSFKTTLCDISEPISTFTPTKQCVEAIRDAIKGHKALAECGLLHQDISANNVSLTKSGQFRGFLHDLDYTIYARERGQHDDCQLGTLSYGIPRKGTHEFMARAIRHGSPYLPKHDLESFFWLLMLITICHLNHGRTPNYPRSILNCNRVLRSPELARARKTSWLVTTLGKENMSNKPLMQLLDQLPCLLLEPNVDHTRMLRVLEDALDNQGWPEDDTYLSH
ncbi:hypothetical protein F5887DRAFT_256789 [Amanita rubescens]|nr:hypothetical protein F5887DRAFT_256789 [Amanita rubescens]